MHGLNLATCIAGAIPYLEFPGIQAGTDSCEESNQIMKTNITPLRLLVLGFTSLVPFYSYGQDAAKPAVTEGDILLTEADTEVSVATGSIFSLDAESVSLTPEKASIPLIFSTTAETPLLDELEKPVARDLVRKGVAATVHYTTIGEKLLATKIIVTRETLVGAGSADPTTAARKRAELTETKVMKDEVARSKSVPSGSGGTLMGFEQILSVRAPGAANMTQYTVNNSTLYVDSAGNPIPPHAVRTGVSLTVQSVEDSGRKIATKVTVTSMPAWVREGMQAVESGAAGGALSGSQTSRTRRTSGETTSGDMSDGFIYSPLNSLSAAQSSGRDQSANGTAQNGNANGAFNGTGSNTNQTNGSQPNGNQTNGSQTNGSQTNANQPNANQPNAGQANANQPNAGEANANPKAPQPGTNQQNSNRTSPNQGKSGQSGRNSTPSSPSQPSTPPASQAK